MAKSQQEWYDEMVAEKDSYAELNEANSGSVTAVWLKFLWVVAYAHSIMDGIFDKFKADVQVISDNSNTGTAKWYLDESLDFQYGDALVWSDTLNKHVYAVVDAAKQIIDHAAVVFSGGEVRIKAAKDNAGTLEPLTVGELAAFDAYWKTQKVAGTTLSVISNLPDDLRVELSIIYDPLTLNADGSLISDSGVKVVDVAIANYISNLAFDGRLWVDKLVDEIQKAQGIVSVKMNTIEAKYSGGVYAPIDQYYNSVAGYLKLDNANSIISYSNV